MAQEDFLRKHGEDGEDIEAQIARETAELRRLEEAVEGNLNRVDESSPSRVEKIVRLLDANWSRIMGPIIATGGPVGIGENMYHGNWGRIAVELGLGAAGGEILHRIFHRSFKRSQESYDLMRRLSSLKKNDNNK